MSTLAELIKRVEGLEGPDRELVERLDRSGECWLWMGATDKRGRGRVWRNGKLTLHHRAIWEALVGPIPARAFLCHHCDNPRCANPSHLYVGDDKSNVADMWSRGRHWTQREPERAAAVGIESGALNTWSKGEGNPKAKLTKEQAAAICESQTSNRNLASQYGVHITTIQRIKRGRHWA